MNVSYASEIGEYNRDQLATILPIVHVLSVLPEKEIELLRVSVKPYLEFRRRVGELFDSNFRSLCGKLCFDTNLSACCGFESIITFFADHVISLVHSSEEERRALTAVLKRPNLTQRCVFLGSSGCLWKVPPISCAMFLCPRVKEEVLDGRPEVGDAWSRLLLEEKRFTWPDKPVLFDELEAFFLGRGVESRQMLFHRSPGLLRIKSKAGLWAQPGRPRQSGAR